MRPLQLLLLALSVAAPAAAQGLLTAPADEPRRPPSFEDGAVLAVVGTGVTVALTAALNGDNSEIALVGGAGLAVLGTSSALGLRPSVPGVALDAAVGTAVGLAVRTVYLDSLDDLNFFSGTEAILVGAVAGGATTSLVHIGRLRWLRSRRAEVAPTTLRAPTGETAAGLSLRLGL